MENLSLQEIINILKPAIGARMLTQEQKDAYEQGLSLLEGASNARSFIENSRKFKDYHRRTRQMIAYLNSYSNSQANAASSATDKRRVGRPTKQEQIEYAELQKKKALEDAKQSLFPSLKPDTTLQPLTYNGIVANPNGESIAATMPNLMQLRPFLSTALQEQVNTVRDLRSEMASKAEQAKTRAEANEKAISQGKSAVYTEDEIAPLATRAVEIESDILPEIFKAVDREMGECYLRLSEKTGDPEYIAYVKKTFTVDPQTLRTQFKPFYEKAQSRDPRFAEQVAEKIANDRPEVKAARDAAAKHKAEADARIKYILRKDKPSTQTRVKGIKERIDQLRQDFSDIVTEEELSGYEAILTKTIEEAKEDPEA
jgi:hypothetical protein|uniref:Uncharacterized protein n=2 Tax=unclassified Caudoviricetes TaxID=2788787 RepID=A0A8S5VBA3_9CAUD|nr:MAG TPA: hypothetical protein [Siphoviridae sp. ctfrT39]DAG03968.1 MAG TPA: hypothetical protein [Siphoviridae sp. ct0vA12]